MDDLILKETLVKDNRVVFKFETRGSLVNYFNTNEMFVEYDEDITDIPISILNIAFVSSVIPLIWLTNTTLWVLDIDRTFYDCLLRLKNSYQNLYPQCSLEGKFISARTTYNSYNPIKESLLLFSGGIDAHVSYLRIKKNDPILCNIQGWYSDTSIDTKGAQSDYKEISEFAIKENKKFVFVKSNFAVLINDYWFDKRIRPKFGDSWWHGFQHSMSFISLAIPLAYKYKVRNIYIASSFSIGGYGKCASYATTDIEFKFATKGGCVHDAFEMSRQQKVHYLVEYQKKTQKPYPVKVCSFNDKNCCECEKCFRTMLEIVAENGDVRNFGFYFDGSLTNHWQNIMENKIALFGVDGESKKHWPDSINRMKENYCNIRDKDFVDWFLNYDFKDKKRKALVKYYKENFCEIIKRKIKGLINK